MAGNINKSSWWIHVICLLIDTLITNNGLTILLLKLVEHSVTLLIHRSIHTHIHPCTDGQVGRANDN